MKVLIKWFKVGYTVMGVKKQHRNKSLVKLRGDILRVSNYDSSFTGRAGKTNV